MGVFRAQYPKELRKVIGHAERFAKVLAELETESPGGAWVVGRSGELRAVVSCAIADWRAGTNNQEATRDSIVSYVDGLHRGAAKNLRCEMAFDCCGSDDAVTVIPAEAISGSISSALSLATGLNTTAATVRAGWVDGPQVLDRFHAELDRVDMLARTMLRRIGNTSATLDDLRTFGCEGLLDAARSFDECRGLRFASWATLRIRSAMIDGLRQGHLSRKVLRELRAMETTNHLKEAADDEDGAKPASTPASADARLSARLGAIATAMAVGTMDEDRSTFGALGLTPEDLMAKAELTALIRDIVNGLPLSERAIVEGYYFGGKTLEEAAADAGVKKSWGSRLHARAIATIERELRKSDLGAVSRTRLTPKS
jgi:RNA polymerase sigma factor for flagellar operon FliA